jgi:hypothetical protein
MNIDQSRLARIRRVHTIVQLAVVVVFLGVLLAGDFAGKARSQHDFRKRFHGHRVDVERGQGDAAAHAAFLREGSAAQTSLDLAFAGCLALLSSMVLLWLGVGSYLHRRYALAMEGTPSASGALESMARLGRLWAWILAVASALAGLYVMLVLWRWESAVPKAAASLAELAPAYSTVLAASQSLTSAFVAWMAGVALSFVLGLILYVGGAGVVIRANREARLRRFERDLLS